MSVEFFNEKRWDALTEDFRINAFAVREQMPPTVVDRPVGTGDWLFMLFHDPVSLRCGRVREQVRPNGVMIWPVGVSHWYGNERSEWTHSWIHFAGTWGEQWLKECGMNYERILYLRNPAVFTDWLWNLYGELAGRQQPDSVIIRNLFHNGLRNLMRDTAECPVSYIPPKIGLIRQYLDQHACERVTLRELAGEFSISIPHLSAEFRRCYGDSPINYMIRRRLNQARYLLLDRQLSIGQIAAQVGYEDLFHFSRLFKRHFGCSPRAMRNLSA